MNDLLVLREKTKRLSILFVEDSEIVRMSTVSLFEEFFDEIFVGTNGKEGYELYKEYKDDIDLVISDVNMPVMNGLEMIRLIRKIDLNVPIFLITGSSHLEVDKEIKDSNIEDVISKPITMNNFSKCMNNIL